jgi:hypothetical protein
MLRKGPLFDRFQQRPWNFHDTIATMPQTSTVKPSLQSSRRIAHALLVAGKGFAISVLKTLYSLWLEVTGLLFGMITAWGAWDLVRQYRVNHFADHSRLLVVTAVTLACAWFTVFSFVKARRTRA